MDIQSRRSGEAATIDADALPLTVESLAEQFAALGLAEGLTVLVHTRMSALGWVAGGPVAIIQALRRVLGPRGTLMMPAHTSNNSDPANWSNPPVPEAWWPIIRAHMPPYDPAVTPTWGVGQVAELFRTMPGVIRSANPINSFAACGPLADFLTTGHVSLVDSLGEDSPLARLYDVDGTILLLGPTHANNTSLHLAETRAHIPRPTVHDGAAVLVNGERRWIAFEGVDMDSSDFNTIGDRYEAEHSLTRGRVGRAEVRLLRQRPLVDYAVKWMEKNRTVSR